MKRLPATLLRPTACLLGAVALATCANAQAPIPVFTNLWNLSAGTNPPALPNDLPASGNNVRGMAINPVTTNVLYASTTGGTNNGNNHITVLDSTADGFYLGQLNASGVGGGAVNLAPVRAGDDGRLYACNVVLSGGTLLVYRWESESDMSTPPAVIVNLPSVPTRYGDYMDVRGAGMDTEIVVTGNGNGFVIFKPAEPTLTTWTNVTFTFPGGVAMAARGVAFDGNASAIYTRGSGNTLVYRVAYQLDPATNGVTATLNLDQTQAAGIDYAELSGVKLISAIVYGTSDVGGAAHRARAYQLTSPSNVVSVLDSPLPTPYAGNGNGLGMTDLKQGRAVFSEPNNGMAFYSIGFVTNLPPSITAAGQPAGASVVEGYNFTLSVSPSGTVPLAYQWTLNGAPVSGATASTLPLTNLQLAQSGAYRAVVTNNYGSVTSGVANVTVLPRLATSVANQLWSLAPGSRDYLTTDNTQRGLTYDKATDRLVLVSRTPTNGVHLLNPATGADIGAMDVSTIFATGVLPLNMVAAADDGAIYACNLVGSAVDGFFVIYRWASAKIYPDEDFNAFQGTAYYGNPGLGRIGDTLAARGAGVDTEILAGVSSGSDIVLFTTADGLSFTPNTITITNLPPDALGGFARLGLAFGPTNTFWAKSTGYRLRLVQYDLASLTGQVIETYDAIPGTVAPLGVDNANGIFAGIGVNQIPQNLELWALGPNGTAQQLDRQLFPVSNVNGNATGNVTFDVPGGRFFALDTNNGLIAASYAPLLRYHRVGSATILTWTGPARLQRSGVVNGTYADVPGATSPYTVPAGGPHFYRLAN